MTEKITKKEAQFNARLAGWLKQLRVNRELTQLELAKKIGVHRNTVARYETGNGMPLFVFLRICECLETPTAQVLKW